MLLLLLGLLQQNWHWEGEVRGARAMLVGWSLRQLGGVGRAEGPRLLQVEVWGAEV